ncbi:sensor histidine kinase [Butyrivibrio sp. XPD2002]|uniref:sensor histidine kinase n=1 Tax=Butyrivibrio sp. XPD2002 TaxID=1280665 RepID=UPI000418F844|nr:HAMP domain-containing sensor histidine kinase [Butyrivibrio sp. XPD2002]
MGRVRSKDKKNKRGIRSLGSMFETYTFLMGFALLLWVAFSWFLFNVLITYGEIYPANYAEEQIDDIYINIINADEVTEDLIPDFCSYVVFSKDGEVLLGNLAEDSLKSAWNAANNRTINDKYFYKVISRTDEYVVLQYSITPQFKSRFIRRYLPDPEKFLTIFIIVGCLIIMQIFAVGFGKRIRSKLTTMRDAIKEIGDQNLDFQVTYSGVREIDECLASMDDMRYALKTSLQKQWKTEQEKNRQMSALAHDIKTPLTVVRGNSELLLETELTDEQKNYADYISGSAIQIQNYVQTLIEVTKSQEGVKQMPVKVQVSELLSDIKKQTMGLSEVYHLKVNWKGESGSELSGATDNNGQPVTNLEDDNAVINVVYDQVVRAVMNVIRNAAEHTPEGGAINITIANSILEDNSGNKFKSTNNTSEDLTISRLTFSVEDSGSGFTPEALAHGTEQFFMDDTSRTGGSHYGIGLFFAKRVAKEHGGSIELSNSKETGGAKVEITFCQPA